MTRSEVIARAWHEVRELLEHPGTLPTSWEDLPAEERALLIAVVTELRSRAVLG